MEDDSRNLKFALACGFAIFFVALMTVAALAGWVPAIIVALIFGAATFLLARRFMPAQSLYDEWPGPALAGPEPSGAGRQAVDIHRPDISRISVSRILPLLEEDETEIYWISHRHVTSLLFGVPRSKASLELQGLSGDHPDDAPLKRQKGILAPLLAAALCLIVAAMIGTGFRPWERIVPNSHTRQAIARKLLPAGNQHRKPVKIKLPEPRKSPLPMGKISPHLRPAAAKKLLEAMLLLLVPFFLAVSFLRWASWVTWYFIVTNSRVRVLKYPLRILPLSKGSDRPFSFSLIKSAAYDGSWLAEKLGFSALSLFTYLEKEEDQSLKNLFGLPHAARLAAMLNELVSGNSASMDSDEISETRQLAEEVRGLREDFHQRWADGGNV